MTHQAVAVSAMPVHMHCKEAKHMDTCCYTKRSYTHTGQCVHECQGACYIMNKCRAQTMQLVGVVAVCVSVSASVFLSLPLSLSLSLSLWQSQSLHPSVCVSGLVCFVSFSNHHISGLGQQAGNSHGLTVKPVRYILAWQHLDSEVLHRLCVVDVRSCCSFNRRRRIFASGFRPPRGCAGLPLSSSHGPSGGAAAARSALSCGAGMIGPGEDVAQATLRLDCPRCDNQHCAWRLALKRQEDLPELESSPQLQTAPPKASQGNTCNK
jgi:hypothetical protein